MILAIDTSLRRRLVALACDADGTVTDVVSAQDVPFAAPLADAVKRLSSHPITAVVVAVGPGSYTGVRTGMAAALGVAQGRGIALHGIGSLAVIAHGADASAQTIRAVSDASRGGVFVAEFARGKDASLRQTVAPKRLDGPELNGDGVDLVVSGSPLPEQPDVVVVDVAAALARAVRSALATPPLDRVGLVAVQVNAPQFAETRRNPRV